MSYEYRVFMVHEAKESTFLHLSPEPMQDGSVIELERPRLPTCPLIPTGSQRKRRLTSRVAPSSRPKEGPCKRERRGLAS